MIFHTGDIQRYRALSQLIRDTFGATKGFENLDNLNSKQAEQRVEDILNNKLSGYVAWLDEQANTLAGKKGAIDRGTERFFGRRIYAGLNTLKSQVGSNMTGFNVRSALTNFASTVMASSKTNKLAFAKGISSTFSNMVKNDGFIDKSDFLTARFGSDSLSSKMWQNMSNAGQIFMTGTDYFTANVIARAKYFEGLQKGMSEQEALDYSNDFSARVMGDRSQGATPEAFNSKTLGLLTQFQLETNNQWQYMVHDTKMDYGAEAEKTNGLKAGAMVSFQMGQLAGLSYLFNEGFEALTGSRVMFDPIEMILTALGGGQADDDDDLEKRLKKVGSLLIDVIPFASLFGSGGRLPISEVFTPVTTAVEYATGRTNKYGQDVTIKDVKDDMLKTLPYVMLPTGYGQLKKTAGTVEMFNHDLPRIIYELWKLKIYA